MDPAPRLRYESALAKARQGDVAAQSEVSRTLRFGCHHPADLLAWTVPCDEHAAFEWTLVAAENGDKNTQIVLSNLYSDGEYTSKNWEEAYFWSEVSGQVSTNIDKHLSDAERRNADRRVAEWKTGKTHLKCTDNKLGLDLCGGSHLFYRSASPALNERSSH